MNAKVYYFSYTNMVKFTNKKIKTLFYLISYLPLPKNL